ncbi:MAG: hypothetical protein ACR2J3_05040 [Aridibacter sp.]
MVNQNSQNALEQEPFSFRQYKNGKISIYWNDREVMFLTGKKADKFFSQMEDASDIEAQMIMAKITGNFKRGNEREAKLKGK